jgi:hypothetical protein
MRAKTHLYTPLTRALMHGVKGCGRIMGACWQCRHMKTPLAQTLSLQASCHWRDSQAVPGNSECHAG